MKSPFRHLLALLLLASPLTGTAVAATPPYPATLGGVSRVYGTSEADFIYCLDHFKGTRLIPMVESDPATAHPEHYYATVSYDAHGVHIGLFAEGERKYRVEECGGSISYYLRPGVENAETDEAPLSFRYRLESLEDPEPTAPDFCPFDNENRKMNKPPHPMAFDTMSYGNSFVRVLTVLPRPNFRHFKNGWVFFFSFDWTDFRKSIPFHEGELPTSWRLILTRTRPDGTTATWGSVAEPVVLDWGRPGDKFIGGVHRAYYRSMREIGRTYRSAVDFQRIQWSVSKVEQWMDHLKVDGETFEPSNPESDALFLSHCLEPVIEGNEKLDKAIYYNPRQGIENPPFESYPKAHQKAIVARTDDVVYFREKIEDIRRDYLLSRFLDEPVVRRPLPDGSPEKSPKKVTSPSNLTTRDLNLEGDDQIIDLDDEEF